MNQSVRDILLRELVLRRENLKDSVDTVAYIERQLRQAHERVAENTLAITALEEDLA